MSAEESGDNSDAHDLVVKLELLPGEREHASCAR